MSSPIVPDGQHLKDKKGKLVSMERMAFNMRQIDTFSAIIFITGGIMAGILGLTGMKGLFLFAAITAAQAFALVLKMNFQLSEYSTMTPFAFVLHGAKSHGMSFVLFWTLFYALVHIY